MKKDKTMGKIYVITRLFQIACTIALYVIGAVLLQRADTLGYVAGLFDLLFAVFGTFALVQTIAAEAGLSGPRSDSTEHICGISRAVDGTCLVCGARVS